MVGSKFVFLDQNILPHESMLIILRNWQFEAIMEYFEFGIVFDIII